MAAEGILVDDGRRLWLGGGFHGLGFRLGRFDLDGLGIRLDRLRVGLDGLRVRLWIYGIGLHDLHGDLLGGLVGASRLVLRLETPLDDGCVGRVDLLEVALVGDRTGSVHIGPHQFPSTSKTNLVNRESSPNT